METEKITGIESAQLAELKAVIRALEISKGKRVTIYTDSAYVVGAIQIELCHWLWTGFNTALGSLIKHQGRDEATVKGTHGTSRGCSRKVKGS